MAVATPTAARLTCPRCKFPGSFVGIDGGVSYRCSRCEWAFTLSTQAPTGTATVALAQGGTAITVASGGASFTTGMVLLFDVGQLAEVLQVTATGTATNIPVSPAVKTHLINATFGQLLLTPTLNGLAQQRIPGPPPYGF